MFLSILSWSDFDNVLITGEKTNWLSNSKASLKDSLTRNATSDMALAIHYLKFAKDHFSTSQKMYFQIAGTLMLQKNSEILSKRFFCLSFLHFFKTCIKTRIPINFAVAETQVGGPTECIFLSIMVLRMSFSLTSFLFCKSVYLRVRTGVS